VQATYLRAKRAQNSFQEHEDKDIVQTQYLHPGCIFSPSAALRDAAEAQGGENAHLTLHLHVASNYLQSPFLLHSQEFGWCHLSAGDLLREERATGSPDAELINTCTAHLHVGMS
jgi:hypothetical protein